MTIQPPPPSPFSVAVPTFQTAWDSTSLKLLKTCPVLYHRTIIEGWSTRSQNLHLTFGTLYAAALERYAHTKARGSTHDEAVLVMVRWALENSGERRCNSCRGTGWGGNDPCWGCEGKTYDQLPWHPWQPEPVPDANVKNRFTLLRTLIWNVDERPESPFQTLILANGNPATELSFNFAAFEIGGEIITLAGHLDEVVEADSRTWIRDDKTTKNSLGAAYFAQFTPNGQMSQYTVAGKVILDRPIQGVLVKAAQIGVNFSRFQTAQIPRPQGVLDEWMRDTEFWIGQARRFAETGHWPLNDASCFLCAHKKVCAVSPSHRRAHLEADFIQRPPWNPLQSRGTI